MNTQDASLMPQEINTEIEYVASKAHGLNILPLEHPTSLTRLTLSLASVLM